MSAVITVIFGVCNSEWQIQYDSESVRSNYISTFRFPTSLRFTRMHFQISLPKFACEICEYLKTKAVTFFKTEVNSYQITRHYI
jgi:hypothetical protein